MHCDWPASNCCFSGRSVKDPGEFMQSSVVISDIENVVAVVIEWAGVSVVLAVPEVEI